MVVSNPPETPLEATTAVDSHLVAAFELLSNETRLAILLGLWDAYDPYNADETVSFSALFDRIGVSDSGNFSYHLDKLVGHFVEQTDEGYRLRDAGLKVIQATIAGTGFEDRTLAPTEIELSCYRCGGPVELSYENEHLYTICTECDGNTGANFVKDRPVGTLMEFDFSPAGLTDRTPEDVFVAATITSLREFGSLIRGICPECTGPIEQSLHVCESHAAPAGETCPTCGTGDEVRVSYVCSVCKHGDSYPAHAAIYDHPTVVAFCHEHGIDTTFSLEGAETCYELWDHLLEREYTLVSNDPVRIRVSVPGDGEVLHLTLDEQLAVSDITREDRKPGRNSSSTQETSDPGRRVDDTARERTDDHVPVPALPTHETCLGQLRRQRWPHGVTCPHCDGEDPIKKGTTRKDTQRYRCRDCDRIFNDLTGTVFAGHRLSLPEMWYIIQEATTTETARIARALDRSYKSVLDFVHEVEAADEMDVEATSLPAV